MINFIDTVYNYILLRTRVLCESKKYNSALCLVTGGVDSCTNAALLLRATSHIPVILIFMGLKESEKDFEKWVINNFPSNHYKIVKPTHPTIHDEELKNIDSRISFAPTYIDLYSKLHNSITFGSITKSEYSLVKFFRNRIDDVYDQYPIIDLYRSEVIQLAKYLNLPDSIINMESISEKSFGYSFEELEWLDRENNNLNIVAATNPPNIAPHWGFFNDRKKFLLLKVYQINKDNVQKIIQEQKQYLIRKALPGAIQ